MNFHKEAFLYQPRNPFIPRQGEVFTPVEYLQRTLSFYLWYRQNRVHHLDSCSLADHQEVSINGFCCLNYLKQCIDLKLLEVAGCRTGIWDEPEGFQVWLSFAWKRLEELEEGHDFFDLWTATLQKESAVIYDWIDTNESSEYPGFGITSFKECCRKHDYKPDIHKVLAAFN